MMGLLSKLLHRVTDQELVLVYLVGGPLDGGFKEIRRAEIQATPRGRVWRAKWREDVYTLYVFETPPEPTWYLGVLRNCWTGRHAGWETPS